jgi:hypothetical protein
LREAYARSPDGRLPPDLDHRVGVALEHVARRVLFQFKSSSEPDFEDLVQVALLKVLRRLPGIVAAADNLRALLGHDLKLRFRDARKIERRPLEEIAVDPRPGGSDDGSGWTYTEAADESVEVEGEVLDRSWVEHVLSRISHFEASLAGGEEICPFHLRQTPCPHWRTVIDAWRGSVDGYVEDPGAWARDELVAQAEAGLLDPAVTRHRNFARRRLLGCLAWYRYRVLYGTPLSTPKQDELLVGQVLEYVELAGTRTHLREIPHFAAHPMWNE